MKNQNKLYVGLAVSMLALIVLLGFLAYVILTAIVDGSSDILLKKGQVAAMQLQDKAVDDFKAVYKDHKVNLEKNKELFVNASNPVQFITFLETIATQVNVTSDVSITSSQRVGSASGQVPIVFQIEADGSFPNLVAFFEKLEAGPYLVSVTNVTMKKIEKDPLNKKISQSVLQAHITVEALIK